MKRILAFSVMGLPPSCSLQKRFLGFLWITIRDLDYEECKSLKDKYPIVHKTMYV